MFTLTKKITNESCRKSTPVKNKGGEVIQSEADQIDRWREHFSEVLNSEAPDNPVDVPNNESFDIDIDTNPPTIEEIEKSIKALGNGKSPGVDNIQAEMLKTQSNMVARKLEEVFKLTWKNEEIPEEWQKEVIIKLPRKGDLENCNNWRGVTLLSVQSKVLGRVIIVRVRDALDNKLREEQAGFRSGKGCMQQMFILRNIIDQCLERNSPFFMNYVDFRKAFDSIHGESLWRIMKYYGIPSKIINLVKMSYKNFRCAVQHEGKLSKCFFPVMSGVRQGCVISGFFFVLVIDWIIRQTTRRKRGIQCGLDTMEDLDFADDLALLSTSRRNLQQKTNELEVHAKRIGLHINTAKTKVMKIKTDDNQPFVIVIDDVETVDSFTYPGSVMDADKGSTADISDGQRLNTFHNRCLCRILRIFWPRTISNEKLYEEVEISRITDIIKARRWSFTGHILRFENTNDCRIVMNWTPMGKRSIGRPKETWRRMAEKERDVFGWTSWAEAAQNAVDRAEWRTIVHALCDTWRPRDP